MLLELLSNALDEWLAGRARTIRIDLIGDDAYEIEDDGGGIAIVRLREALARVHDHPTLDGHRSQVHLAAWKGIGMATVCALSEAFEIDTSDGTARTQWTLARGEALAEPVTVPAAGMRGTRVRGTVDTAIFAPATDGDAGFLRGALDVGAFAQQLADYAPGLEIHHRDRSYGSTGLVERARRLGASEHRPLLVRTTSEGGSDYRLVVGWRDDGGPRVEELVGNYRVAAWHEDGWIGTALQSYAKLRGLGPAWKIADGRVALCAIEEPSMKWGTPTGDFIVDPIHRHRVRASLYAALDELCGCTPADTLAFTRVVPR
jgi:hypothetical protein